MSARGITYEVTQQMVTEQCCNCGVVFAMAKEFHDQCRARPGPNGKSFYCPAGHGQHYQGETEADKLRRERDRLAQRVAQKEDEISMWRATADDQRDKAEHERRRANGYKGHAAKITKRAKAGICPCCNRHFVALERHMATKHPTFTPDAPDPLPTLSPEVSAQ